MRIFSYFYNKVMQWARHPHAQYYLAVLSFAESSFFPIPPDVMLIPMSLGKPQRALWYAFLTTLTSALGGLLGYLVGMFFFVLIHPYLLKFGYWDTYLQIQQWFTAWGFWIIFVAGFAPIPYKLFTIAAGAMHIALLPFFIASFIGRGTRFFILAAVIKWGGESMEQLLYRYIDKIGWATLLLLVTGLIVYQLW